MLLGAVVSLLTITRRLPASEQDAELPDPELPAVNEEPAVAGARAA